MPDMRSRRYSNISVMKATHYGNGFQFRRPGRRRGLLMRNRSVAIQALMRPSDVVIVVDVFPQEPVQMRLV